MTIPESVKRYLAAKGVRYKALPHARTETLEHAAKACNIALQSLARAVILKDKKDFIMAVLPASHMIDFAALNQLIESEVELVPVRALVAVFQDCEPGSFPPLGAPYGMQVVVDESLDDNNEVFFEPGVHTGLIRISIEEFHLLNDNARRGTFARPLSELKSPTLGGTTAHFSQQQTARRFMIQHRMEEIQELPAMPDMVNRLLQLRRNPLATADDLAKLVEVDPSLAAQITRYATSPFYGYRGTIESIRDAIARVMGFDVVMNIALGIAIGKSFQIPQNGPLGMRAFWRHAIYSAVLCQRLVNVMPFGSRPLVGMAYLAGLLHDFGHLLMGHLYQSEFFLLNRLIIANPEIPVTDLERHVMTVEHEQIGAWLMRAWGMPEELTVTVRWHHREQYDGKHAVFSRLALIADHLLKSHGIGDAPSEKLPATVMEALGITEEQALTTASKVIEHCETLDALARQLVD